MAFWTVEFSKEAYKSYGKLQKGYRQKIDRVLGLLVAREKTDLKPLKGQEDIYRLRIGRYRMLFKKYEEKRLILVIRIAPRGDAYKK